LSRENLHGLVFLSQILTEEASAVKRVRGI